MRTGALNAVTRRLLGSAALLLPSTVTAQVSPPPQTSQTDEQPPPPSVQVAPVAVPQQGQAEAAIIITGSRIPRPNLTAVSPVTVITNQEVKLEGAVLTESLINSLPQVRPNQGNFISNGATGTATIDLRGLGTLRTLVLVNGRRLLPGDPTDPAADINVVPSALIKRVEVLTGGASSVYGSDAIAGVVNFILETRLEGLRLDGQSSFYQHQNRDGAHLRHALIQAGFPFPSGNEADGGIQDINAAFGQAFAGGRGHVTAYAGYRKIEQVTQAERDYSACTVVIFDTNDPIMCGGSLISGEGSFFTNFDLFHLGESRTFVSGPPAPFNFAPFNYFQRAGRRYTAGGFGDFELSDALKPYFEFMFMDDRTVAQIAPSGDFAFEIFEINCDNPLLSDQQRSLVCFSGNFVGETPITDNQGNLVAIEGSPTPFVDPVAGNTYFKGVLGVGRRNIEGGPRRADIRHKDLRAVGGVKGDLVRGLSYDASYLFGKVRMKIVQTNDLLISRLVRARDVIIDPATGQPACRSVLTGEDSNCVPWDVFELGAVTPEAAAYLGVPVRLEGTVKQRVATAFVTAELQEWGIRSPWANNGPALNVGAEYRKDTLDLRPDEHYQSNDISGVGFPILPFTGSTQVKELFGELRLPFLSERFVHDLTFEGGYRQSWYKNGDSSFTTNSYKLALEFTPIRGIRFRASHQRAVRAPNVQELFAPSFREFFDTDPCTGLVPVATPEQCARTGVTAEQYGRIIANPLEEFGGGYHSIAGGNLDLEPEKATTRAIGIVLQPRFFPGFSATVDWFDIQLKGSIAQIGAAVILDSCVATGDPFFCGRVHRDANGSLWMTPEGFVDDRQANIGAFKVRGIDVGSTYTQRLGRWGSANLEFIGTWLDRYIVDTGGLATPYDCAGLYGYVCGSPLPRWRHNARLTWNPGSGVSLSVHWRHIGKVRVDRSHEDVPFPDFLPRPSPLVAKIGAQNYFDLTGLLNFQGKYSLRLGVRNIFDREPPVVAGGVAGSCGSSSFGIFCNGNTYPQLYDPLGRYVFAGATVDF